MMFINKKAHLYYIAAIESPHHIWYPININIPEFSDKYIAEKFGITNPKQTSELQRQFLAATKPDNLRKPEMLDEHELSPLLDIYPFYLTDITDDSVTLYIEKGMFTLYPKGYGSTYLVPRGYPWAMIYRSDTPEIIQAKLYDDKKSFGLTMHRKLKKIMGW